MDPLAALAEAAGEVPDVYDESLLRAVHAFQQRRGLIVDGVVGPQTYIALDGARWKLGDRLLSYTPGHLIQGDDVAELQERLALPIPNEHTDRIAARAKRTNCTRFVVSSVPPVARRLPSGR